MQKWAVATVLVTPQAIILLIVAVMLSYVLPAGSYGTILAVVAMVPVALQAIILIGRIIRRPAAE